MNATQDDALKAAVGRSIGDTLYDLSTRDADPIRDSRIIADAALKAIARAGYRVVPNTESQFDGKHSPEPVEAVTQTLAQQRCPGWYSPVPT